MGLEKGKLEDKYDTSPADKEKNKKPLKNSLKAKIFQGGYSTTSWVLIILFLTVVLGMTLAVILSAFGTQWYATFLPEGFTIDWFVEAWKRYDVGQYFKVTMEIVFTATVISLLLSIPTVYILARRDFPFKQALISFFQLPFTLPDLLYAIPVASIFYSIGLAETIPGLIIVNLIVGIPFSIFILLPYMESLDPRLEHAAQSLGASRFKLFQRIIVPQIIPGITVSAVNIFIRMFNTFTIILLIAGTTTSTLNVMVFNVIRGSGTQPPAMLDSLALTLMIPLLLFSFLSLWVSSITQRRFGK